jgi:hypothetical protein
MKKARKQPRPSQAQPSRASLLEIPEVDLKDGRWRPNPYAARIATEGMILPGGVHLPGRGRPRKGAEVGGTTPRSVRFSGRIWEQLEEAANAKGLTLHAALRAAILEWAGRNEPR